MRSVALCLFILLVGATALHAEDLGDLSANPFNFDSTANQFGRYGSPFSPDSINNPFGAGSPFKADSPNNPYGKAWRIEGR